MPSDKIVLWDADGVIFHSYDANRVFYWPMNLHSDLGIPDRVHKDIFSGDWLDVLRGIRDTRAHVQEIFARHNVNVDVERYIEYWLEHDTHVNDFVIDQLTQYTSYVATNQDPLRTRKIETLLGEKVKGVFASSQFNALKPEPEYYHHIERNLGVPVGALFFIDDNRANVEAAAARGWNAHHYTNDEALAEFLLG